ncbi:HDIG domain-containing metalloprotein [Mesorhizobium sp. SB112]|uniref:HDIG domain-containing metalloprotein n=1 Tax=Mesorhizobium sp. SB112 TaxID=3151853 RepID=UPI0032660922
MTYTIDDTPNLWRSSVENWLFGLDHLSAPTREKVVTAWQSTWSSSSFKSIKEAPWDAVDFDYTLADHVNEVTRAGLNLAAHIEREWEVSLDPEILVPILILHDVDKPLMFERKEGRVERTALYHEIPHGVVGGMLLKELGFPHHVVATVTTHSPRMPFPGRSWEAYVLHYADYLTCDHAMMRAGEKPFYFFHDVE